VYTRVLQQEYYTNQGVIPTAKIFDALFSKVQEVKKRDRSSQVAHSDRLMQHVEKVRQKNKINQLGQDMENEKEKAKQVESLSTTQNKMSRPNQSLPPNYKMYDHQMKCEMQRKARMIEAVIEQNQNERKQLTQAKASQNSKKMMKNKAASRGNVHTRLYKESKQKPVKSLRKLPQNGSSDSRVKASETFDECTFHPNVNSKYRKNLPSSEKFDERLMRDATKRRQNHDKIKNERMKIIKLNSKPKHSSKSNEYAFKKFVKEYESTLSGIDKEKDEKFNFDELCSILSKLGFVNNKDIENKEDSAVSDVWIILGGESQNEISEASIFHIACIILNFDREFLYGDEKFSNNGSIEGVSDQVFDKNTVGVIGKDGVFYIRNQTELERLHQYFYDLTFNRINFVNKKTKVIRMNTTPKSRDVKTPEMFKPKIDDVSDTIEKAKNEKFGKVPRFKILMERGKEYKEKVSNKAMELKDKELDNCTFKPDITRRKPVSKKAKGNNQSMSIEESNSKFKNLLNDEEFITKAVKQGMQEQSAGKGKKKVHPIINKVFMEIKPGRDPIIKNTEVIEEYKNMGRVTEGVENQQSTSLDDKIKESQQCYKSFTSNKSELPIDKLEFERSSNRGRYSVTTKGDSKHFMNYFDQEFKAKDDEERSKTEYSHNEEQRYDEVDKQIRKQYRMSNGYIEEEPSDQSK